MFNLSLNEIDIELKRFYCRFLEKRAEALRMNLSDSPKQNQLLNQYDLTKITLGKFRRLRQKEALALMSWYMPEGVRFLVQLGLREVWGGEYKEVMEVLLTSKDFALTWLLRISNWTERSFFGNVLTQELAQIWESCDFQRISQKKVKRYTGYCRGYRESTRNRLKPLPPELQMGTISYDEDLERKLRSELTLLQLMERVKLEYQLLLVGVSS
jgi:hypothetical protein